MTNSDHPAENYTAMAERFERMAFSTHSLDLAGGYRALAEGYRTLARHTAALRLRGRFPASHLPHP